MQKIHAHPQVVSLLAVVAKNRNSLAAIHRIKGIKEETVSSWLERAETQVKKIDENLVVPHKLSCIQADADARLL